MHRQGLARFKNSFSLLSQKVKKLFSHFLQNIYPSLLNLNSKSTCHDTLKDAVKLKHFVMRMRLLPILAPSPVLVPRCRAHFGPFAPFGARPRGSRNAYPLQCTISTGATHCFSANHKTNSEQKNQRSFISGQSLRRKVVYFRQRQGTKRQLIKMISAQHSSNNGKN